MAIARKSIVATKEIHKGELFTEDNIGVNDLNRHFSHEVG